MHSRQYISNVEGPPKFCIDLEADWLLILDEVGGKSPGPFVLYMGEGVGSATSLLDLHVSMTFKEYVNPIWTGIFPNLRRLNEGVQKRHSKLTLECPGSLWNGHTVH